MTQVRIFRGSEISESEDKKTLKEFGMSGLTSMMVCAKQTEEKKKNKTV